MNVVIAKQVGRRPVRKEPVMLEDLGYQPAYLRSRTTERGRKVVWDFQPNSVDRYLGYRALWLKVIIRAAFDWVSYRDSDRLDRLKDAESGYRWIFEPSTLLNSFENVCAFLDVSPDLVRYWVKHLTKDHVAKIEHLERESHSTRERMRHTLRLFSGVGDEDC